MLSHWSGGTDRRSNWNVTRRAILRSPTLLLLVVLLIVLPTISRAQTATTNEETGVENKNRIPFPSLLADFGADITAPNAKHTPITSHATIIPSIETPTLYKPTFMLEPGAWNRTLLKDSLIPNRYLTITKPETETVAEEVVTTTEKPNKK